MTVEIFTDGACRGNPGPGGWAAFLRYGEHEKLVKGAEMETTNNRMELMAAIQGLKALNRPSQVSLTTDSQYVRQGITQWINGWKKNGWRTSQKQPVKNQDLWQLLDESCLLSGFLMDRYKGDKLNVAALGNQVPQLHLHHLVRYQGDPAWPAPVWGKCPATSYAEDALDEIRNTFTTSTLKDFEVSSFF